MELKNNHGTPFDYSDKKIAIYFEVADKLNTKKVFVKLNFINEIKELKYGLEIEIAIQQIPEVLRNLVEQNIAVYSVIQRNREGRL